jgi:hypothetical protein
MEHHGHCKQVHIKRGCFEMALLKVPTLPMEQLRYSQWQIVVDDTTASCF